MHLKAVPSSTLPNLLEIVASLWGKALGAGEVAQVRQAYEWYEKKRYVGFEELHKEPGGGASMHECPGPTADELSQ